MPLAILHSAEEWAEHFGKSRKHTAVTIGNFDGVHLGHQEILRGVLERARGSELRARGLRRFATRQAKRGWRWNKRTVGPSS